MIAFERLIVLCIIAARVWAASSDFGHADGLVRSPAPDGASPTGWESRNFEILAMCWRAAPTGLWEGV